MADTRNPFQDWLDNSQKILGGKPMGADLAAKCEGLFKAWERLADVMAKAGAAGEDAGPFDPAGWVDMAGGGGFGDLWAWFGGASAGAWPPGMRALKRSREWAAYNTALTRYRAVLGSAWLAAFTRFAEEMTDKRRSAPDLPEMQDCWQRVADEELATAQRSQSFLDAQSGLIRARLDCAALIRRDVEELASLVGLPTRAEIDSLHENVQALRREVRAVKRGRGRGPATE